MSVTEVEFKAAYLVQETAFLTLVCHLVPYTYLLLLALGSWCGLLTLKEAFIATPI